LDQAQSLNLYMSEPSGAKMDNIYKLAWVKGLKTTYYLRTMGATHVEKSTLADGKLNAVEQTNTPALSTAPQACLVLDPECEACQ
jgi:ribonucleoside-diphosphate reductase alpha chain